MAAAATVRATWLFNIGWLQFPLWLDLLTASRYRASAGFRRRGEEDPAIIEVASIFAVYAVLHNPLFGAEARALLAEVRRSRHNLGLVVVCQEGKFAFGVHTGVANVAMDMIDKPQAQEKFPTPEARASEAWRTRADPEWTAEYGVPEAHAVMFEPVADRAGMSHTVGISIPETSEPEIRHAINIAIKAEARTLFTCDTAEQAEAMAAYAAPLLPGHHRMAYERAEAGKWGSLV
jgi:hypothetical protein